MKIKPIARATPLDEETLQGLIPNLTTQTELNEFVAENILEAMKWAGEFRKRGTNIGVDPKNIQPKQDSHHQLRASLITHKTFKLTPFTKKSNHKPT